MLQDLSVSAPFCSSPSFSYKLSNRCDVTVNDSCLVVALTFVNIFLGVIHYNMTVEEQAQEVRLVKKYKNGFITDPTCLSEKHTLADVDQLRERFGYSGFPITSDGKMGSKLVGIVTNRDVDYIEDRSTKLADVMTKDIVTGKPC